MIKDYTVHGHNLNIHRVSPKEPPNNRWMIAFDKSAIYTHAKYTSIDKLKIEDSISTPRRQHLP